MAAVTTERRYRNIERALMQRDLSPRERATLRAELHAAHPFRWETWDRICKGLDALGFKEQGTASNGCGLIRYTKPSKADPSELLDGIGLTRDGDAWVGTRFDIRVERTKGGLGWSKPGGVKVIMLTHPEDGHWVTKALTYFERL